MRRQSQGFTLAELAIVTVVVGLLLGSLLLTMSTQLDQRKRNDTQQMLELARDALIGYAIANGRLPCPAAPNATGTEVLAGGTCTYSYNGFYPATTVGITPVDSQGYLLDAWNNRIRYAVTNASANAFITANGMKNTGLSSLSTDLMRVCATSTNMVNVGNPTTAACDPAGVSLTTTAVAVIYSTGRNTATGGTGADEAKNLDGDRAFISHDPTDSTAANGEFDDIVTWLSPNVLYNRMVAAGAI